MSHHPSHKEQLASLKRIEGQVRGVIKMIEDGKWIEVDCFEVVTGNSIKL